MFCVRIFYYDTSEFSFLNTKQNPFLFYCCKEKSISYRNPLHLPQEHTIKKPIFPYEIMNNFALKIQKINDKICSFQR